MHKFSPLPYHYFAIAAGGVCIIAFAGQQILVEIIVVHRWQLVGRQCCLRWTCGGRHTFRTGWAAKERVQHLGSALISFRFDCINWQLVAVFAAVAAAAAAAALLDAEQTTAALGHAAGEHGSSQLVIGNKPIAADDAAQRQRR